MLFRFGTKLVFELLLVFFHLLLKLQFRVFEASLVLGSLEESTCSSLNFDSSLFPFLFLSPPEFLHLLLFSDSLASKNTTDETLNRNCGRCNFGVLFLHKALFFSLSSS